jgi:quercetin dioxygenase-like cupin family protein
MRLVQFAATVAWLAASAALIAADDPIVPVYHEPHHRQVFQYGSTRILDVQIPPGDTSWYHSHEWPILYVTLSSSQNRVQNLGEEWGGGGGRGGNANAGRGAPQNPSASPNPSAPTGARVSSTTSYVEKPVTHRLQNVGERLFRLVAVINETRGDAASSQEATGFAGKPELTNPWYRAYRFTVNPGEATARHRHSTPAVIVQTTEGHGIGAGAAKFDFTEPGRWAFFDAGDAHEIRNISAAPIEFVEVEVRGALGPTSNQH